MCTNMSISAMNIAGIIIRKICGLDTKLYYGLYMIYMDFIYWLDLCFEEGIGCILVFCSHMITAVTKFYKKIR